MPVLPGHNAAGDVAQSFIHCNAHHFLRQFGAQPLALPWVAHQICKIRIPIFGSPAEPADAEDLVTAVVRFAIHRQCDFAIIVVKANAREPLAGDALIELQYAEIAEVHAVIGKRLVELNH